MAAAHSSERSHSRARYGLCVLLALCLTGLATPVHGQSPAAHKELVRLYFEEVVNEQRLELVDSIFSRDYRSHSLNTGTSSNAGSEGVRSFLLEFFQAFPDVHYTIDAIVAEHDRVAVRLRANGTQRADFLGIPPTGGRLDDLSEIFFFRFENGKIAEGWQLIDMRKLLRRLNGTQAVNDRKYIDNEETR